MDPTRVDPSVVRVLDGLRARTRGTLAVRSTPPGAEISLDGKVVGLAPLEATTVIGKHKLTAKFPGSGTLAASTVLVRARRETYVEWVEGATTNNPLPVPNPPEKQSALLHPFGEARGLMEIGGGVLGGLELGGGVELKYFRIGLDLRVAPFFGLSLRVGVVVPLIDLLSLFVDAELPAVFPSTYSAFGVGGEGGVEWHPVKFLGFFAAVGGRHLVPIDGSLNNPDRVILSVGLRVRVP